MATILPDRTDVAPIRPGPSVRHHPAYERRRHSPDRGGCARGQPPDPVRRAAAPARAWSWCCTAARTARGPRRRPQPVVAARRRAARAIPRRRPRGRRRLWLLRYRRSAGTATAPTRSPTPAGRWTGSAARSARSRWSCSATRWAAGRVPGRRPDLGPRGRGALAPWLPPGEPVAALAGRQLHAAHGRRDRITRRGRPRRTSSAPATWPREVSSPTWGPAATTCSAEPRLERVHPRAAYAGSWPAVCAGPRSSGVRMKLNCFHPNRRPYRRMERNRFVSCRAPTPDDTAA